MTNRAVASPEPPALALRGLTVSYRTADRELELITGVSLDISLAEIVCLVGGSVTFGGRDATALPGWRPRWPAATRASCPAGSGRG